jgi:tight adherence protein B
LVFPARIHLAREKRLRLCDQQMPQALRLVTLSLRAGQALPSALALAAKEGPNPIRGELQLAVEEHALGVDMGTVFEHLAIRLVRCEAAHTLCVAVRVLEQTGGNLIAVIDNIIDAARARTQYEAKLRALTAEGRMSAMILGAMPPGFFLIVGFIDPTYWPTLFGSVTGLMVLGLATGMWLMGVWWSRVIIKRGQRVAMS